MQEDEFQEADRLLDQADALLRRHRTGDASPAGPEPAEGDDLPILTDVVDESELDLPLVAEAPPTELPPDFGAPPEALPPAPAADAIPAPAPAAPAPAGTGFEAPAPDLLTERLIRLDTELSREVERWVNVEFPQILARELDRLTQRMQTEMLAHLRATLLSELSDRISNLLDHQTQEPPARR
ncbi:hypothetical protein E6O51_16590 [Pseudothauera rhizosphaerae]|uniref:Uncharacterized protein n=1 Tax=Pseudothauera rhizosphaerae TaxID=2565932 RepID=A0A4V3WAF0_9RHOO|nr:hypothetical protein E6O51_16590 [Pseudothauera rhizosphaerae]